MAENRSLLSEPLRSTAFRSLIFFEQPNQTLSPFPAVNAYTIGVTKNDFPRIAYCVCIKLLIN